MTPQPLNVETSRSAIVDREECDRLRLLGWELDGAGYQPRAGSVATLSGIHIHEGTSTLLNPDEPGDIETAVKVMREGYAQEFDEAGIRQAVGEDLERIRFEQLWVLECMLRGWHRKRWANFCEEYEVMSTERQWRWPLAPGITLPLRMDAIVRRRDDGLLHIVDFKGTAAGSPDWQAGHEISRQTVLYLTALEEHTGEHVGGMVYEGLVRGSFRRDTAQSSPFFGQRIQNTPYAYAYKLEDRDCGMHVWRSKYTSAKGWVKAPVWDDHTVAQWLDVLDGEGALDGLFIAGQPVSPPPTLRQSMRRQIAHQEREWFLGLRQFNDLRAQYRWDDTHPAVQEHLEVWAIQKTGRCNKYGEDHRCPFAQGGLCFLPEATELLSEDEMFQPRVPHHAPQSEG